MADGRRIFAGRSPRLRARLHPAPLDLNRTIMTRTSTTMTDDATIPDETNLFFASPPIRGIYETDVGERTRCSLTFLTQRKWPNPNKHCARGKPLTATTPYYEIISARRTSRWIRVIFLAEHRRRVARERRREPDK